MADSCEEGTIGDSCKALDNPCIARDRQAAPNGGGWPPAPRLFFVPHLHFFPPASTSGVTAVGMCPPWVDQTARSRQQWHILAPSLASHYDITDDCMDRRSITTLANSINGDFAWDAFDKLVNRPPIHTDDLGKVLSKLSQVDGSPETSPIEALPTELLAMVLSDDSLRTPDLLSLGVCSNALWQQCLSQVLANVSKGPWINTHLICTGTYLDDLPPSIHELEPSLRQQEDDWRARMPRPGQGMRSAPGMCPARRWNWGKIAESTVLATVADEWLNAFDSMFKEDDNGILAADRKVLRKSLNHVLSVSQPKLRSHWTLRNHTTRQYVQLKCAYNGAMEPQLHVKGVPLLSLDKALLMRLCWTKLDYPAGYNPAAERVLRGQWAGHRFDVVSAGQGSRGGSAEGWEDVTGDLVKQWKEWKRGTA